MPVGAGEKRTRTSLIAFGVYGGVTEPPVAGGSRRRNEELPFGFHAFEGVKTAGVEAHSRAAHQIANSAAHHHFAGVGGRRHSRRDVDRDTGEVTPPPFALTRVNADANRQTSGNDRVRTPDRLRRTLEGRQEAVAGCVDLPTTEATDLCPHRGVVAVKLCAPRSVAHARRRAGRAD